MTQFMRVETHHGIIQLINNTNEGDLVCPIEHCEFPDPIDAAKAYNVELEDIEIETGWISRLSAPGYLDCTGWSGVYKSEKEAIREIRDLYDIEQERDERGRFVAF